MFQDLRDALKAVDPKVLTEEEGDVLRVSLPGGPSMAIRPDYFQGLEDQPVRLLFYAERIIEKIREEMK